MTESAIALPSDPASVRVAREAVRSLVDGSRAFPPAHDAELVASELVTNAVVHGAPPVELRVRQLRGALMIEVCDGSPEVPSRRSPHPTVMGGRGLVIVDRLASAWGCRAWGDGKCVWASFTHTNS